MRIRLGVSPDIDTETMGEAIDAALESVATSQVPLLQKGVIPDIRDAIKAKRVKWRPEPPGDEHFDDAKTVLARGWGDCDDLAPWLAASLRASGEAPEAFPYVYQSGPKRWHAVVDDGDGNMLDPSRWAGMGKGRGRVSGDDYEGVVGAAWAPMWEDSLALAVHPHTAGWAGRVDIPDQDLPVSWSTIAHAYDPVTAIRAAIHGACGFGDVAGDVHDDDMARLIGIDALLASNGDLDTVAELLGDDYVGFLPMLAPAAAQFAAPMAQQLMSKIPLANFVPNPMQFMANPMNFVNPMKMANMAAAPVKSVAKVFKGLFGHKKKKHRPPPPSPSIQMMMPQAQQGIPPGATVTLPGGAIIVKF